MNWTTKYRPNQVKKLHLTQIRQQLVKFMNDGFIPKVLLFAGPKGTGKTSSSRLVAAVLNDKQNKNAVASVYFDHQKPKTPLKEPNLKDRFIQNILTGQSYTVAEIDAASHRGIDDVRELKERAFTPPMEGMMSVFILDEVHMLTTPAFNALLKLLEEPPDHAVFILATTEPEKIPATVISRCQVLNFRKANQTEIIAALEQVVKSEKVKAGKDSLKLIAQLADGSFRDAIKYLELAVVDGQVSIEQIKKQIGSLLDQEAATFLKLILDKNEVKLTQFFQDLREKHQNEQVFHKAFIKLLYHYLTLEIKKPKSAPINTAISLYLLKQFNDPTLSETVIPFLGLELKALEIIEKSQKSRVKSQEFKTQSSKSKVKSQKLKVSSLKSKKEDSQVVKESKIYNLKSKITQPKLGDGQEVIKHWDQFLGFIEQKNTTIAALLRSARPAQGNKGKVIVHVYYRFHQEQLTNPKIINLIQDALNYLSLGFVEFEFVLKEAKKPDLRKPNLIIAQPQPELAKVAAEVLT